MFKKIINLLLIIGFITFAQNNNQEKRNSGNTAQSIGILTIKVIDKVTNKPLEYANFVLFKKKDSTIYTGGVTSSTGDLKLENLAFGRYFAKISFIGYKTTILDDIQILPQKFEIGLNTIELEPTNVKMNEVVVSSERDMVVNNLDKKVINVDKNIASMGGSAIDVMQNIPAITVDADNNVSLRGNKNVTILIDGRPSGLENISAADVLTQIPASSIESIELVTNPSARYDPDGTAGIINIILKKKTNLGLNGIISLNAGTRDKYNTSINLNLRNSVFNIFGSYDGRINNMSGEGTSNRISNFNNFSSNLNQVSANNFRMNMHSVNLGTDFLMDDLNTLTFQFQYRNFSNNSSSFNSSKIYDAQNILTRDYNRKNDNKRDMNSLSYTLSYKKTFEKKFKELTADVVYSSHSMKSNEDIYQQELNILTFDTMSPFLQKASANNTNKMFTSQINFINPMDELGRIETGIKINIQNMNSKNDYSYFDNTQQGWIDNVNQKNYFNYLQQIYSAYFIYSNNIDLFKFQFGLRAEQVYAKSELENANQIFNKNYFSLYPSVHLVQTLPWDQEVMLSYSRRVDRPQNRQLNPHLDISDSLNIFQGNPDLNPQYINSFEFGYTKYFGKTSISANTFYKLTNDLITMYSTLRPDGITYTTFKNLYKNTSYGAELVASAPLFDWWRINFNYSYFRTIFDDQISSNNNYSWTTKINTTFNINSTLSFQLMGNYNAPMITPQGKMKEMYFADIAIKQDLFDGKLSVLLRVSDIFNSRKFDNETYGNGFTSYSSRTMDSRNIFLGISYKLNNYKPSTDRKKVTEEGDGDDL